MITEKTKSVKTGFRLEERVLARVKEAARRRNISANEFVNETLKNAKQRAKKRPCEKPGRLWRTLIS